jgi:hypothetical protein
MCYPNEQRGTTVKTTEHTSKTPRRTTGLFALLGALLCIAGSGASATLPATASAYATPEAPPIYSSAPGLPDNRVYEQVSPADKNGNEAGAKASPFETPFAELHWGYAAANGESVLFEGTGPMGESPSPDSFYFVASRNKQCPYSSWCTRSVAPAPHTSGGTSPELLNGHVDVDPSPDLSHAMLGAGQFTLAPLPNEACNFQLYLAGSNPFVPATWLSRPQIENPVGSCAESGVVVVHDLAAGLVGGTPNFSTVYFSYAGTLLPEDASRAQHLQNGAPGFYEDHEGELREADVLSADSPHPGEPSPFGAVPAASPDNATVLDGNQVSENGLRAFFVSPDPAAVGSCVTTEEGKGQSAAQAAAACAPQLYVRENGEKTLLLSQSQLPGNVGEPAPGGPLLMPNDESYEPVDGGKTGFSYVFASPDGSQAFFQSEDALTEEALKDSPGTEPKTYDFDLETGVLTYLPGASGKIEIVAADTDGSSFAFKKPASGGAPAELDLWSAGPNGGSVIPVTQLPKSERVSVGRMSSDGSVLAFQTEASIAGFNNGGTHNGKEAIEPGSEQVYRYDAPANTLGCVSCPPHGVLPSGSSSSESTSASMSTLSYYHRENPYDELGEAEYGQAPAARGISADGDQIFFDTPDPLVPQDTNTDSLAGYILKNQEKQGRDVYEWENGVVYLISSGKSPQNSILLDSSANGDDVFFATTEGLVPGDTDGAFDVYDARIPHEGDNPPAAAVPCEGSVCQGPPNVPAPLTPPASATFSGLGNPTPEVTPPPPPTKTTTKTVKCKKGFTKKKNKCMKNKKAKKAGNKQGSRS